MRLKNYLQIKEENAVILEFIELEKIVNEDLNEGEKIAEFIEKAARKLGLRVEKSTSFFSYIKTASKSIKNIVKYYTKMVISDDQEKYKKMMKDEIKRVNKRDMAAFLLILDKSTLGVTSHLRHILQGVAGIEITAYYKWKEDLDYMLTQSKKVREVLLGSKMGEVSKPLNYINKFISSISIGE